MKGDDRLTIVSGEHQILIGQRGILLMTRLTSFYMHTKASDIECLAAAGASSFASCWTTFHDVLRRHDEGFRDGCR
jgi:hypothetical protein